MSFATSTRGSSPLPSAATGDAKATAGPRFIARSKRSTTCSRSALRSRLERGALFLDCTSGELARQDFELCRERPFSVVVAPGNPLLRSAGQRVVVQQHQVHIEKCRQLRRRLARKITFQDAEFCGDRIACDTQAVDLCVDSLVRDVVVSDIHPARGNEHCATDRDTPRDRQAEHLEAHEPMLAARVRGSAYELARMPI